MDDLHALRTSARPGQVVVLTSSRSSKELSRYDAFLVRLPFAQRFGQDHDVSAFVIHQWLAKKDLLPIHLARSTQNRWSFRVPRLEPGRYAYAIWCRECNGHMAMSWPILGVARTTTAARLLRVLP